MSFKLWLLAACLCVNVHAERVYEGQAALSVPLGKRGKALGSDLDLVEEKKGDTGDRIFRIQILSNVLAPSPIPVPVNAQSDVSTHPDAPVQIVARPTPRPRVRLDPAKRRTTEDHLIGGSTTTDQDVHYLLHSILQFMNTLAEQRGSDESAPSIDGKGAAITFSLDLDELRIVPDGDSLKGHPDAQAFLTEGLRKLGAKIRISKELRSRLSNPVIFRLEKT